MRRVILLLTVIVVSFAYIYITYANETKTNGMPKTSKVSEAGNTKPAIKTRISVLVTETGAIEAVESDKLAARPSINKKTGVVSTVYFRLNERIKPPTDYQAVFGMGTFGETVREAELTSSQKRTYHLTVFGKPRSKVEGAITIRGAGKARFDFFLRLDCKGKGWIKQDIDPNRAKYTKPELSVGRVKR